MADANEPIRLGLIGTGLAVELLHWPALRRLRDRYVVTAFAESSPEQANRFVSYSGVDGALHHSDYHELLARDDVDAVLITLPIPLLYAAAKASLEAGKELLCEKPTGADETEAKGFLTLVDEHPDRTILIGENFFYRDEVRFARQLVDEGAIGRPHLMCWRTVGHLIPREGSFTSTPWRQQPQYRGGAHLDAGIHNVAQIRMLCGDATLVHGSVQWANSTIDAPSDLTLGLEFASGAIGSYTASYSEIPVPHEPNDMRLYGTEGTLVLDHAGGDRRAGLHRPDGTSQTHLFHGGDGGYYNELCNFFDAVRHGEPIVGTIAQTYTNMLLILRALDSADRRTTIAVDDLQGTPPEVPLWRPRGANDLLEGLPVEHSTQ